MKTLTLVNKDERTQISSPPSTFFSRLLNMRILNHPLPPRKTTHVETHKPNIGGHAAPSVSYFPRISTYSSVTWGM